MIFDSMRGQSAITEDKMRVLDNADKITIPAELAGDLDELVNDKDSVLTMIDRLRRLLFQIKAQKE